jgi:hypothetical protein
LTLSHSLSVGREPHTRQWNVLYVFSILYLKKEIFWPFIPHCGARYAATLMPQFCSLSPLRDSFKFENKLAGVRFSNHAGHKPNISLIGPEGCTERDYFWKRPCIRSYKKKLWDTAYSIIRWFYMHARQKEKPRRLLIQPTLENQTKQKHVLHCTR